MYLDNYHNTIFANGLITLCYYSSTMGTLVKIPPIFSGQTPIILEDRLSFLLDMHLRICISCYRWKKLGKIYCMPQERSYYYKKLISSCPWGLKLCTKSFIPLIDRETDRDHNELTSWNRVQGIKMVLFDDRGKKTISEKNSFDFVRLAINISFSGGGPL